MANQSRDWHRSEGSRSLRRGQQSYRDFDDDNRHRRGSGRWDEDSNGPRSAEGIGDYGGYSEEGGSYGRGEQFGSEWRDQGDRGYFGTDGGPDYGRAYDSSSANRFGRGGYDQGQSDYGAGGYEQSRYGQGEQGNYGQRRYGQSNQGDYGRGSQQYGQGRSGSNDFGGGRRDFGQRGYGSESRYGSPQQWGGGDYGAQGGSSFAYGRGGENWGGSGYAGSDYGPTSRSGYGYGDSVGSEQWNRQASHRGKGPKGYERSDDRLKEMISERLSDDPNIDASEITIAVSGGVVKLTGTIDSRAEKYQVEELIERCGGVKDIDNQLRTQSRQSSGQGQGLGRQSSSVGGASGLTGSSGSTESGASGRDVTGSGATGTSSTRKQ
jgi:BON domain